MNVFKVKPDQAKNLPNKPGVYTFYNKENQLIYVGKAKNLKKRVTSYYQNISGLSRKTQKLVTETSKIEVAIVNSEMDALLLENSLIKENQPRYNILLKDDKTFPFICISNERFPRIYSTRKRVPNAGKYFGPYTSVKAMNIVIDLLRKLYHIRTCKYNLSQDNIDKEKFKVCLEYHLNKCKGPCVGKQEEEEYNQEILQATNILKNDIQPVKRYFRDRMAEASKHLEFEKAENLKQKLLLLDKFQAKTVIVNSSYTDIDVFAITSDDNRAYINFMKIKNGAINHTKTIEVRKKLNESNREILILWIIEIRKSNQSVATELLTNEEISMNLGVLITVPKIGDKRKLVELSLKNALYAKREHTIKTSDKPKSERTLNILQDDLKLQHIPKHIECFDNSNISGSNPVASMVYFKNGKPHKKNYRKFKIKTVSGPDDFASMKEIVTRRYKRVMNENESFPDLIIIDGGKGQLNAAVEALHKLNIYGHIPIIGIAKKLEEIYFPGDEFPIYIDKKSPSLKLIQQIRNEAHRFAITFHRDRRSQTFLSSELDGIKGIGEKSKNKLIQHFKSISHIKKANIKEISAIIGLAKAKFLVDYFNLN